MRGASRHKLYTLVIVTLTVQVGSQVNRCLFVVVQNLVADALLGCSSTDQCVEAIMCRNKQIVLENGDIVPIQCRQALKPINGQQYEQPEVVNRASNSVNAIRTAERFKIPAFSDKIIAETVLHSGPRLVGSISELMSRKCLSIDNNLVNIRAGQTFHVRITNHSDQDRFISKTQVLVTQFQYSDGMYQIILMYPEPPTEVTKKNSTKCPSLQ